MLITEIAKLVFPGSDSSTASTAITRKLKKYKTENPNDPMTVIKPGGRNKILFNGSFGCLDLVIAPMLDGTLLGSKSDRKAFELLKSDLLKSGNVSEKSDKPTADESDKLRSDLQNSRNESEQLTEIIRKLRNDDDLLRLENELFRSDLSSKIAEISGLNAELADVSSRLDKFLKSEQNRLKKDLQSERGLYSFALLITGFATFGMMVATYGQTQGGYSHPTDYLFGIGIAVGTEVMIAKTLHSGRNWIGIFPITGLTFILTLIHFWSKADQTFWGYVYGFCASLVLAVIVHIASENFKKTDDGE